MPGRSRAHSASAAGLVVAAGLGGLLATTLAGTVLAILLAGSGAAACPAPAAGRASGITLAPGGGGSRVGATEYGGPGDPSSGTVGASGQSLTVHPNSYAELGGTTFQTATALGGLAYMTPLRITWGGHSVVAYKRDFGLGGGPVSGLPRVIDLWWELAGALRVPYEHGMWSGPVRLARPAAAGAGNLLGGSASDETTGSPSASSSSSASSDCGLADSAGVPLTSGPRAKLLAGGRAAAPAGAPAAIKGIIAAGNQIVGKPYVYGGGHGLPLDQIAPGYDCSSSVEHLLYGGHLLPVDYDAPSGTLESFGRPGAGRWVTIYASADHVFMYVAGLRWDTHNAAGSGDGSTGIGWHPLVRSSAGFVARHPSGL